jgi:glycosyltransferase involved in cell wall biosynthesis
MSVRLALHGAVNNSAYGLAKGLVAAGADAIFVRSRDTTLPIDQPVWQDSAFTMSAAEFAQSAGWSWDRWTAFEVEVGWQPPRWMADPAQHRPAPYAPVASTRRILRGALGAAGRRRPSWTCVQEAWADRDLLVVSGSTPTLLASGSGLPYLVWPHGSDARTTVRDFGVHARGARGRAVAETQSLLLRQAYRDATALVTHDPLVVTGDSARSAALDRLAPIRFLAWPVDAADRAPAGERQERLAALLDRLEAPQATGDVVALVASRIDYALKGHDRLIEALTRLGDHGVHYLFVGWGSDLPRARRALEEAGLGGRVSLLPRIMSKPVMRELYASVDLTLDQFVYGTYGTAALEAMAVGTPVVMAVDEEAFAHRGWEPPPALQARTADQLTHLLTRVGSGQADLEDSARRGLGWVRRRHSPEAVHAQLQDVVREFSLVSKRDAA